MKHPIVLLFVDDSPTVQKVVELAFDTEDVQVVTARSGTEALEKIQRQRPDIVIADISMEGMTGYDLCGRLKSQPELAAVPVLLLASSAESYDEEKGREARADGHILKPFKSGDLVNLVKEKACSTWNIPEEPDSGFDSPFPLGEAKTGGADFDPLTATAMVKVENFGSELLSEAGVEGTPSIHDPDKTVEFETGGVKPRSEIVFTRETDDKQVEREILKEDLLDQTGEIVGMAGPGGVENIFAENADDLDRLEQDILAATGGEESYASGQKMPAPETQTAPPSTPSPEPTGMLELGSNLLVDPSGGGEADEEAEGEEYSYEIVEGGGSGLSGEAISLLKEAGLKPLEEGPAGQESWTPAASAGPSAKAGEFDRFFGEKGDGLPELTDNLVKLSEVGFIPGPVPRKAEASPGREKEKLLQEIKTLFPDPVSGPLRDALARWVETALETSIQEAVEKEVKKLLPNLLKQDGPLLIRSAFQAAWDKSLPEIRKSVESLTRRVVAEVLEKQGHKPQ